MSEATNYFPEFGGSTGGWLQAAETEEKYVMTWTNNNKSSKFEDNIFEMPTGGAAIMNVGANLLHLATKEQCLALGKQLQTKFEPIIESYKVYRVFPDGNAQLLYPIDGVASEVAKEGRSYAGKVDRKIGANPVPVTLKFSDKAPYEV